MITGISIENFKGIREQVKLDLRPITLLFGANSAGKSTILHALHYAREVFERHNLDVDRTVGGGEYVDLGGFHRILPHSNGADPSQSQQTMTLRFDFSATAASLPDFGLDTKRIDRMFGTYLDFYREIIVKRIETMGVEIVIANSLQEGRPFVRYLRVFFDNVLFAEVAAEANLRGVTISQLNFDHPNLLTFGDFRIGDHSSESDTDSPVTEVQELREQQSVLRRIARASRPALGGDIFQLSGTPDALPSLDEPIRLVMEQTEIEPPPFNASEKQLEEHKKAKNRLRSRERLVTELCKVLSRLILGPCLLLRRELSDFRYLGPLRDTPSRNYEPPRFPDPSRWSSGLGAWDSLHTGPDELVDAVGQWLGDESHLNAGCTLERRSYLELDAADPVVRKLLNRQAFDDIDEDEGLDLSKVPMKSRIVIVSGKSDAELRPHDVGIGISQVVPVIVTAVDGEERLLAIEQPELHIHPRLQAAIADLFIESIHKNKHRFIIETHSEHLILRLLRRIRETEKGTAPVDRQLRTDELGIYYLKQENGSTTANRIDVDVNGEFIQPWPDDFFEIDFFERFPDAR